MQLAQSLAAFEHYICIIDISIMIVCVVPLMCFALMSFTCCTHMLFINACTGKWYDRFLRLQASLPMPTPSTMYTWAVWHTLVLTRPSWTLLTRTAKWVH